MSEEAMQKNPETPTEAAAQKSAKPSAKKRAEKVRVVRNVPSGHAYIQTTYNNTLITLTDPNGNAIAWSSAGHMGFKGPRKATPYAATVIVKDAVERTKPYQLREVHVFLSGIGPGRESAVRSLNANGLDILSIKDTTPIPHNGPRARKVRRV